MLDLEQEILTILMMPDAFPVDTLEKIKEAFVTAAIPAEKHLRPGVRFEQPFPIWNVVLPCRLPEYTGVERVLRHEDEIIVLGVVQTVFVARTESLHQFVQAVSSYLI